MKQAFDIPAINNQKGVLAKHLGIDYDDNSIEERFTSGDIHRYIVSGKTYFVASQRHSLAGDVVHSYNSSLWHILPLDSDQPYMRFTDKKVTKHLESIALNGFSLLGINQKEQLVLFRNDAGLLVVWGYTAHVPEDISTYFFQGSTADMLNGMKYMFNNVYQFKNDDQTVYCRK
jgi:hypothetical protein